MLVVAAILLKGVRLLRWLGQNTLLILLWHKFPIMLFQITPLGRRFTAEPDSLPAYAAALAVICASVAFSFFVGKLVLVVKERLCS